MEGQAGEHEGLAGGMGQGGGAGTEQEGWGRERELAGGAKGLASRFPTVAEPLCLYGSTSELGLLWGS